MRFEFIVLFQIFHKNDSMWRDYSWVLDVNITDKILSLLLIRSLGHSYN